MARTQARTRTEVTLSVTTEERVAGIERKAWFDDDQNAYVCRVKWDAVKVDPSYQRRHDGRHSTGLAEGESRFCPYPILTFRNGALWADDGQHRIESYKKKRCESGYAVVIFGLDSSGSANLFFTLNQTKRQNSWVAFKAALHANRPLEVAIRDACERAGLTLKIDASMRGARPDLTNVDALREAYSYGILDDFLTLLTAFKKCGEPLDKNVVRQPFQRGIIDVLRRYGGRMNIKKISQHLRALGSDNIMREANAKCPCGRTERIHYAASIIALLQLRGALLR